MQPTPAIGGNELPIPAEFNGEAQLVLYTRYGDPRAGGFEQQWITPWNVRSEFSWFPKKHLYIHKHFCPLLREAFRELDALNLFEEIKSAKSSFKIRPVRGSKALLSLHSWGCAIDLNRDENPLGSRGTWSNQFIETMTRNGIYCGQSWTGRKDPSHFSMLEG